MIVNPTVKYTVIGDIVSSKSAPDRSGLQELLVSSLREVNRSVKSLEELRPTVGDEIQGTFPTLAAAVQATLQVRLQLLAGGGNDSRFGIGLGEVTVFDRSKGLTQDGPGWWYARAAIDHVEELAQGRSTSFMRVRFAVDEEAESPLPGNHDVAAVNAFLVLRDQLVGWMNPRRRRLLLGALKGERQVDLAAKERIEQSTVSHHLSAGGINAILAAERQFGSD
jgi:SatD family (SatD)